MRLYTTSFNEDRVTYRVGPHLFCIGHSPGRETEDLLPSFAPFVITESISQHEPLLFELHFHIAKERSEKSSLPEKYTELISFAHNDASCTIYQGKKGSHIIDITPVGSNRTFRMECENSFKHCTVKLIKIDFSEIITDNNSRRIHTAFAVNNFLMMLYAFNGAHYGTLIVHASVVTYAGKGYLFLGKSGTGKSTHSALWLKHCSGSCLLNDDNPILHVVKRPSKKNLDPDTTTVTVYGSPWSGKTPCYKNDSAPAGAMVKLEQASYNEMVRKDAAHAFADLLVSCSCLKQDRDIYDDVVSTVIACVSNVPFFGLKCLPNTEAVEMCKQNVLSESAVEDIRANKKRVLCDNK